ncbi:unnamed protein product, partial [Rotaria magnacalcarata]
AAAQSIQKCRDQIKAYQQKEKQLYANIFAKMAKQNEKMEAQAATVEVTTNEENKEDQTTTTN